MNLGKGWIALHLSTANDQGCFGYLPVLSSYRDINASRMAQPVGLAWPTSPSTSWQADLVADASQPIAHRKYSLCCCCAGSDRSQCPWEGCRIYSLAYDPGGGRCYRTTADRNRECPPRSCGSWYSPLGTWKAVAPQTTFGPIMASRS